jgi:hypothetical protein
MHYLGTVLVPRSFFEDQLFSINEEVSTLFKIIIIIIIIIIILILSILISKCFLAKLCCSVAGGQPVRSIHALSLVTCKSLLKLGEN